VRFHFSMASLNSKARLMTLREHEIAERRDLEHRDKVLTFAQWCTLNGFSKATGRRIIKRGEGPPVLQLSPRRIGVRESDNRFWQRARVR
jgi:predicted DNA-binding transcriptional regulator AlpA